MHRGQEQEVRARSARGGQLLERGRPGTSATRARRPWRSRSGGTASPAKAWRDQDDAERVRHDPSFRVANDSRHDTAALEHDSHSVVERCRRPVCESVMMRIDAGFPDGRTLNRVEAQGIDHMARPATTRCWWWSGRRVARRSLLVDHQPARRSADRYE